MTTSGHQDPFQTALSTTTMIGLAIRLIMVGILGGTVAYGIVGLFFGPIVLSVAWTVIVAWVLGGDSVSSEDRFLRGQ